MKRLFLVIIGLCSLLTSCPDGFTFNLPASLSFLEMSDPVAYVSFFLRDRHKPTAYATDLLNPPIDLDDLIEGYYYPIPGGAGTYTLVAEYSGTFFPIQVVIELYDDFTDYGDLRFGKENTFYEIYFQEDKAPTVLKFPATLTP